MPTVITTPADPAANSYVSVAEADAYHATHLYASVWTAATVTTKETAVIHATRVLDLMYKWAQWSTTPTQKLQWPRTGVEDFLRRSYIGDLVIPSQLKDATAEFARQLIVADRTADSDIETQGITSLGVGSVSLSFKESVIAKVVPDAVVEMIPSWWGVLDSSVNAGVRDLARA